MDLRNRNHLELRIHIIRLSSEATPRHIAVLGFFFQRMVTRQRRVYILGGTTFLSHPIPPSRVALYSPSFN